MRLSVRHALPVTLIAGLAAVACAGAAMAPELSVMKAASELGDAPRAAYTLSVSGDEDALVAFNEELKRRGAAEAATAEDIEASLAFLNSRIRLTWDKGRDREALADDLIGLRVDVDGIDDAVEIRYVKGRLYARAQARRLATHFGAPAGTIDEFVAKAEGAGFDFLDAATSGGWLAHDLEPVVAAFKGILGDGTFPGDAGLGLPDLSPETLEGVVDSFSKIYGNDVDVTRGTAQGPGTHYRLSASARDLYEGMKPVLDDLPFLAEGLDQLPGGAPRTAGDIPDDRYSADVWVRDSKITRIEFDLAQVAGTAGLPDGVDVPRITLRLDVDRSPAAVTAPTGDVTELDVFELIGGLVGNLES